MEWQGNERKQTFMNWVDKANKEELKEYAIEQKYPVTKVGKRKRVWRNIGIWIMVAGIYALAIFSMLFYATNTTLDMYGESLETTASELCSSVNLGEFFDVSPREEYTSIGCGNQSIVLKHSGED